MNPPVTSAGGSSARDKRTESGTAEVQPYSIDYAIPASPIRFSANDDVHHAVLDFAYSAFDDKGSVLARTAVQFTSDLNPAKYRDAVIGGLRMHQQVEIPVTATALRVGVQDELGRRLGTLELSLPVKAPADDPTAHTLASASRTGVESTRMKVLVVFSQKTKRPALRRGIRNLTLRFLFLVRT